MIYLDNAATTEVHEDTIEIINKYLKTDFFNPSALYGNAVSVAMDVKRAREKVASILNSEPSEIIFLSSGTEGDNAVLLNSRKKEGARIIISEAEHSAVYNTAMELQNRGFDVKLAPVDRFGRVKTEEFKALLNDNTALVSIIHVNNETGAINPIKELAGITKAYNNEILFHSDGVQAFTKVPINLKHSMVDCYSISGHKINAPKGIAGLFIKKGAKLKTILYGGGQENNIRSSTENTSGIMAMQHAASDSILNYSKNYNTMKQLLKNTAEYITLHVHDSILNTDFVNSSPNILSIAFMNIRGEVLMHAMEKYGVILGIGSACSSKKGGKRIPEALKLPKAYHEGMIRISINPGTTEEELHFAAEKLVLEYDNLVKYMR